MCEANPMGLSDKTLSLALPSCTPSQRVEALNNLLKLRKIDLLKKGDQLIYKLNVSVTRKSTGGGDEEDLVLKIVEKAGNKGIWVRDIRHTSNLPDAQLNKVIKNLESKKLIKKISSVNASKRKVYMLYDLEPDATITGGAWYSDNEFESEFVDVLNDLCFRFLETAQPSKDKGLDPIAARNSSYRSSTDVWKHINNLKVSKVKLSIEDIETILDTLIYDGKVEKTSVFSGSSKGEHKTENLYRILNPLIPSAGLMRMPCGVCMVFNDCYEGGEVSPSTCQYMKEWLEF